MKKKWITFCFILVIVTFTGIMLYIRADNNLAVRNSFSNSWRKYYVVEEKSIAYVNTTPKRESGLANATVLLMVICLLPKHYFWQLKDGKITNIKYKGKN